MIKNLLRVLFLACALSTGLVVGLDAGGGIQNSQFCRIELPSVNHSLVVRTTSAITTNNLEYTVQYCDFTTTTTGVSYGTNQGKNLTNTPDRTLLAAPAANTIRVIRGFTINNTDTASAEVQIDMAVSGTNYRLYTVTLAAKATFSFPESLSGGTSSGSGVTSVGATSPITSSGGATPTISTSISTNKLVGRGTAGSGVMEEITLGTNLSLSGTTLNASGSGVTKFIPGGRLTLTSATPVTTSNVTSATTIYYALYLHDQIPIYDGSSWTPTTFTELTNDTTASSTNKAGPAAVTTNSNYDLFVWSDSGTIRLTRGPLWTSDTGRGTGAGTSELERINGIWMNKQTITNGPAADRGTYVGTVRSDGSSQINDSTSRRCVWNMYNRVKRSLACSDSTNSWTYTTATFRQTNNDTTVGTNRVEIIRGLDEDSVAFTNCQTFQSNNSAMAVCGIGISSTSTNSAANYAGGMTNTNTTIVVVSTYTGTPGLGYYYIQRLEQSQASGTTTWYGDNGSTIFLNGMTGESPQ